jgi:hypothetical protein
MIEKFFFFYQTYQVLFFIYAYKDWKLFTWLGFHLRIMQSES